MPTVTFEIHNATAQNLYLLNFLPAAGWSILPPNLLPAHAGYPSQARFADTQTQLTLSYGPDGGPHNVLFLPASAASPATVNTTPNVNAIIQQAGADYRVTLTLL